MNATDRQRLQRKRQRTIRSFRLISWIKSIPATPLKLLPVLLFCPAAVFAWQLKSRYLTFNYPIPILNSVFQYVFSLLLGLLAFLLFIAMLFTLSTPRSAKHLEDALLKIGLIAHDGTPPVLIARTRIKHTNAYRLTFYSLGVSKGTWEQRKEEIEDVLNLRITEISYGGKRGNNRNLIRLTTSTGMWSTEVPYDDEL